MTRTVYDRLLTGIALGDYVPGSALTEREFAVELGVSRTPGRERMRCDMEFHDFLDRLAANETFSAAHRVVQPGRAVLGTVAVSRVS